MLVCWQRSLVLPDFTVFDYPTTHEFEHSWNNTQLDETIFDGAFIINCSELRTKTFTENQDSKRPSFLSTLAYLDIYIYILKKENKSTKNILVTSVNIFRLSSLSTQTKLLN